MASRDGPAATRAATDSRPPAIEFQRRGAGAVGLRPRRRQGLWPERRRRHRNAPPPRQRGFPSCETRARIAAHGRCEIARDDAGASLRATHAATRAAPKPLRKSDRVDSRLCWHGCVTRGRSPASQRRCCAHARHGWGGRGPGRRDARRARPLLARAADPPPDGAGDKSISVRSSSGGVRARLAPVVAPDQRRRAIRRLGRPGNYLRCASRPPMPRRALADGASCTAGSA